MFGARLAKTNTHSHTRSHTHTRSIQSISQSQSMNHTHSLRLVFTRGCLHSFFRLNTVKLLTTLLNNRSKLLQVHTCPKTTASPLLSPTSATFCCVHKQAGLQWWHHPLIHARTHSQPTCISARTHAFTRVAVYNCCWCHLCSPFPFLSFPFLSFAFCGAGEHHVGARGVCAPHGSAAGKARHYSQRGRLLLFPFPPFSLF